MNKFFSIFAALMMASTGLWAETVNYIDADGQTQSAEATEVISMPSARWGTTGTTSWYVVKGTDVSLDLGAICNGDVRLILADGYKLTVKGINNQAGIQVSGEGNSLTIYAQSTDTTTMGKLIVNGGGLGAGIGGGWGGSGSNITINGGMVTATGGNNAAGIGGGNGGSGSYITINGGIVTANGGYRSAGIGGGFNGSGSNITINGGTVTAIGNTCAAGIGGGWEGSGSYITINGGTVTAIGADAAGIGGGQNGSGSYININGGTVTAIGYGGGTAIGRGVDAISAASNIFVSVTHRITGGEKDDLEIAPLHTSTTDIASDLAGIKNVTITKDTLTVIKISAVAKIDADLENIANDTILTLANKEKQDICDAKNENGVNDVLADWQYILTIYAAGKTDGYTQGDSIGYARGKEEGIAQGDSIGYVRGKEEGITEGIAQGKAEALGSMAEPCENCTAVEVKKGDKVVTLYAPDQVTYKKEE